MTRVEMLAELRMVLDDVVGNHGWADATLIGYLAEGQDKFCEETGYFRDITSNTITLAANVAVYDIPDRTIQILDIWDGNCKLGKILDDGPLATDDWPSTLTTQTGVPTHWRTDKNTGVIEVYPTPSTDAVGRVLTVQVWRYSEYDLADTDGEPEIPTRFQRACIEWAAYKAINHLDLDTFDTIKSKVFFSNFAGYVSDGRRHFRRFHNQETRVGSNAAYRT